MKQFIRAIPGLILLLALLSMTVSCVSPQATVGTMQVDVLADGQRHTVSIQAGSTVQRAIEAAGVELDTLDRVEPPAYTTLTEGAQVSITRIQESFEIDEVVIPFDRQTIRNETLPEGETRLLQPGKNGLREITYRILYEEGQEVSRSPVKDVIIEEAVPEIVMVGVQAAYTPFPIEGRLAYLTAGNAWILQGTTANRRPVVLTGDLDGRVFQLSENDDYLLFTRLEEEFEDTINSLWAASTLSPDTDLIDLQSENIIHFAAWVPGTDGLSVIFSTVEPRPSPPGWQANNDLIRLTFTSAGVVLRPSVVVESNAGGQYGWWGTSFAYSPRSDRLAYARADGIGLVDQEEGLLNPIHEIVPYQTLGDWAWVPWVSWGHDDRTLFFVDHGEPVALESAAASPVFNVVALPGSGGLLTLTPRSGMFAYPLVSPLLEMPGGEVAYQIAFLQAISPLDSESSNYRLMVMDRDGSNLRALFPPEGEPGLEPHPPAWSPGADQIAVLYRGDLWVVDVETGIGQPLTSDGQTVTFDWNP
jgi:hypothetical protein